MILKIRTKDNLEELVRHRNSPSWVIAEYRENQIKKKLKFINLMEKKS